MTTKVCTVVLMFVTMQGCGGSRADSSIPAGTYLMSSVNCQTGTLAAEGDAVNAQLASNARFQIIVIPTSGTQMLVSSFLNADTSNGCSVETVGPLTYDGTTVTYAYGAATWTATGTGIDGSGGCPAAVAAASLSYDYVVGTDGNIATFALAADDPNYLATYCTSGKVGRTFEKYEE